MKCSKRDSKVKTKTIRCLLAERVLKLSWKDIASADLDVIKYSFLDQYGIGLSGSRNDVCRKIQQSLQSQYAQGSCSIWGSSQIKLSSQAATFFNTLAAHALDFDDTGHLGFTHPSVVIVPLITALAENLNSSGKEMLLAYVCGFEAMHRVALAYPNVFVNGWFTTALLGGMAAAISAGRMLELDSLQLQNAIGIAINQTGVTRANNGTSSKWVATAQAAEIGLRSAFMAQAGVQSSERIFEEGYFPHFASTNYTHQAFENMSDLMVSKYPVAFKPYPCCSSIHSAIEATLEILRQRNLKPEQIIEINCQVTHAANKFLIYKKANTPQEAQFCLPYCLASSLVCGAFNQQQLSLEYLRNLEIIELMSKIKYQSAVELGPEKLSAAKYPEGAWVKITLDSGLEFQRSVGYAIGSKQRPFDREMHLAKFYASTKNILNRNSQSALIDEVIKLENLTDINLLTFHLRNALD